MKDQSHETRCPTIHDDVTAAVDHDPTEFFSPDDRRRHAVPAVPVRLADGRTWHFASATDRYRPTFVGDVCVGAVAYRGFPPSCQPAMDALIAESSERPDVSVSLVIQAAVSLVRKAHNLSAGEAAALLHVGQAELTEIVRGLSAACRGAEAAAEDDQLVAPLTEDELDQIGAVD